MASTPGLEPAPHWWEAGALTTAPPLLLQFELQIDYEISHLLVENL